MRCKPILIFLFISFSSLYAQDNDSSDEGDTLVFELAKAADELEFKRLPYQDITGFQHYRPLGRSRLPMARSGNIGLATHSLLLRSQTWDVESHIGGYHLYLLTHDSMRYYRMSRPFTQLSYANGSEEEQFFQVFHSQNLGEGMNIAFQYDRITSPGFFLRQLSSHTRFHSTMNAHSRNKRYKALAYFYINDLEAQENGGVVLSDNDDPNDNTTLLDIGLRDAQNQSRSRAYYLNQSYDIIRGKDSTTSLLTLGYALRNNIAYRNYSDDVSTQGAEFFDNYFLDNTRSADSTMAQEISHEISLMGMNHRLGLSYRYADLTFFQNFLTNEELSSQFIKASFLDTLFGSTLSATFEKGIAGFQQDELELNAALDLSPWKGIDASFFILLQEKQPGFFWLRQRANHHFFENDLTTSKEQMLGVKLEEEKSGVKLELRIKNLNDWVYFDSLLQVQQEADGIQVIQLEVQKEFVFLKNWHLNNRIAYQSISNQEVLPLPEITSFHSLYYENSFFQKSLDLQVGADFYFISGYQGYAYSPSLAQFHLRNEGNELGNIQQLDFFLNLGISKAARVFFKYENALLPTFSEDSYRVQDYPIPGRVMKLGLSWRMLN